MQLAKERAWQEKELEKIGRLSGRTRWVLSDFSRPTSELVKRRDAFTELDDDDELIFTMSAPTGAGTRMTLASRRLAASLSPPRASPPPPPHHRQAKARSSGAMPSSNSGTTPTGIPTYLHPSLWNWHSRWRTTSLVRSWR